MRVLLAIVLASSAASAGKRAPVRAEGQPEGEAVRVSEPPDESLSDDERALKESEAAPAQERAPEVAEPPREERKDERKDERLRREALEVVEAFMTDERAFDVDDASLVYAYLERATATEEHYPWAQLLLGRMLLEKGYTHGAAVWFARIARERANPEVLPRALEQLRQIAEGPHHESLIDEQVFGSLDVAFLPESLKAYAHFQQGLADLKAGDDRWAKAHFAHLTDGSPEAYRATYAVLVTRLKRARNVPQKVLEGFKRIAEDASAPVRLRIDAQLAVARLFYENGDYEQALKAYEAVQLPPLDPGRAALYLEEAWTRYRMRDLTGALGVLTTLDAPSFRDEFLPDKYLLRAIIFQEVCHYLPAKRAAREMLRRFSRSLEAIQRRADLTQDPQLRRAAVAKGAAQRAQRFLELLEAEAERLHDDEGAFGKSLYRHLREVYGIALAEAERVRDVKLKAAVEYEANKLLDAAEQVRLVEYEVGLELYRRIQADAKAPVPVEEDALSPEQVAYGFNGEYWNDELRDYRFELKNRCEEETR